MKNVIICLLLIHSALSFGQKVKRELYNKKQNLVGIDLSVGPSVYYKRNTKAGFAGAINYSRISKEGHHYFEIGVRFTQLNFITEKRYKSYKPLSDTYTIGKWHVLYFDIPIGFKKTFSVSDKMNIMVGFNFFYSTYIRWYSSYKTFSTKDDSFIGEEKRIIKPVTHDKLGLETGLGLSRFISPNSLLFTSINVSIRSEIDLFASEVYVLPNLTIGYRYFF